jgi:hypothetical protein
MTDDIIQGLSNCNVLGTGSSRSGNRKRIVMQRGIEIPNVTTTNVRVTGFDWLSYGIVVVVSEVKIPEQ